MIASGTLGAGVGAGALRTWLPDDDAFTHRNNGETFMRKGGDSQTYY